jgi:cell shape-determining protein MreD
MTDRRKAMRLTLILPWFVFGAFVLSMRLNGIWLKCLVAGFAVAIVALLIYVVMQMVKVKRGAR